MKFKGIDQEIGVLLAHLRPAAAQGAPDALVSSFLDNWKIQNYDAMYNQISEKSRNLTPFSVFETTYHNADIATGTEDLTYTIGDVSLQGTSAAVTYDVTNHAFY